MTFLALIEPSFVRSLAARLSPDAAAGSREQGAPRNPEGETGDPYSDGKPGGRTRRKKG